MRFRVRVRSSLQVNHSHTHIHKGSAGLRLLPFGLLCRGPAFLGTWLQYSTGAGPIFTLAGKELTGFLHQPHGLLPCPRKETPCSLDQGSIFSNTAKVVSSHLTKITPSAEAPGPEVGTCSPHQAHSVSRKQSPLRRHGICRQHCCTCNVPH